MFGGGEYQPGTGTLCQQSGSASGAAAGVRTGLVYSRRDVKGTALVERGECSPPATPDGNHSEDNRP
eukprot:CAMPEP_0206494182 /NCGR_PEP_ID=MMETSP0324_2-20121206/47542_1 /ASSEMBLY_ACC=CAM_ASM_000836 /TAXON_ID=2866 /ORGANISM="Crypthecodinium cohnii, Strain Seligo" /LENGTH=66 /DNA_ID=CAMNT_0053977721 /DNA_START=874 /DNA_END=1074 /DNA_ORIENTATION=-